MENGPNQRDAVEKRVDHENGQESVQDSEDVQFGPSVLPHPWPPHVGGTPGNSKMSMYTPVHKSGSFFGSKIKLGTTRGKNDVPMRNSCHDVNVCRFLCETCLLHDIHRRRTRTDDDDI